MSIFGMSTYATAPLTPPSPQPPMYHVPVLAYEAPRLQVVNGEKRVIV